MCKVCQVVYATTAGVTLLATSGGGMPPGQMLQLSSHQQLPAVVAKFTPPEIDKPEWYQQQEVAEQAAQQSVAQRANRA